MNKTQKRTLAVLGISLAVLLTGSIVFPSQFVDAKSANSKLGDHGKATAHGFDESGHDVRWILPGPRALSEDIFGTTGSELRFDDETGWPKNLRKEVMGQVITWNPMIDMPMPTPFSNRHAVITGEYDLTIFDKTKDDDPNSRDRVNFSAQFTSPNGSVTYYLTATEVVKEGDDHSVRGGVSTEFEHHGTTRVGTALMPTVPTYMAFWSIGNVKVVDNTSGAILADQDRLMHLMTTCSVRTEDTGDLNSDQSFDPFVGKMIDDYDLIIDEGTTDCNRVHTHLMIPPADLNGNGMKAPFHFSDQDNGIGMPVMDMGDMIPTPGSSDPLGNMLMGQPFIHVMFENIEMKGIHTNFFEALD